MWQLIEDMWIRKRLDIGWRDLVIGMLHCILPTNRDQTQRRLERFWSPEENAITCLSVRSGFDLLLGSLNFPPGSEVLISALTIPDMPRLIERHHLVPVPIDVVPRTLAPDIDSFRNALSPATRAVVVAHLFGSRCPMQPILELAKQHRLTVIEDCAQAFVGPSWRGHVEADVSMFSFGPIKTATALGGGLISVRNPELLETMRTRQTAYPIQTRRSFLKRLVKYSALKALSGRAVSAVIVGAFRAMGRDYDRLFNRAVRGFEGPNRWARIRQRPSSPLMRLLERRLRTFDGDKLKRRVAAGNQLESLLLDAIFCPNREDDSHTHWVFPIAVDDPDSTIDLLRREGFDATQGGQMCVVPEPSERPELAARQAADLLRQMVYVPLEAEMSRPVLERLARLLCEERCENALGRT